MPRYEKDWFAIAVCLTCLIAIAIIHTHEINKLKHPTTQPTTMRAE
jgi:hypothetical protein